MNAQEKALAQFCAKLAELPRDRQRAALVEYFQSMLSAMSIQEIEATRKAMAALHDGPGPGEFVNAIDAHLAMRSQRN